MSGPHGGARECGKLVKSPAVYLKAKEDDE